MAAREPVSIEADALSSLEERILRAVQLVTQLRQEKEAAEQLADVVDELRAENVRLNEELESLRSDRKQVRTRIEKLLGQLDTLAG